MNYAILTDNSTTATTLMNGVGANLVVTFPNHTLWAMQNATVANILTVQRSTVIFASVLLPNPL